MLKIQRYMRTAILLISLILTMDFGNLKGQPFEIYGKVTDALNYAPMAFVNIVINNGKEGTTSDIDGNFHLLSNTTINYIELSYVGYETEKIQISKDNEKLLIRLRVKQSQLEEVLIFPKENPAHRIINHVIENRDLNNPEKQPSFKYHSYNKITFTAEIDSSVSKELLQQDTVLLKVTEFTRAQYLLLMLNISERKFLYPDKNYERILASKVSGFKDPVFILLATQLQSFSVYNDYFVIGNKHYVNPVSKGSLYKYFFLLEDTAYSGADTVFIISFRPLKNKVFDGLKGVLYINTHQWAVQHVSAQPAIDEEVIGVRVQQKYDLIGGQQWFPVQLNTDIYFKSPALKDVIFIGNIRGYLTNIKLNPDIQKKEFSNIGIELDANAINSADSIWFKFMVDSLTEKDLRTFQIMDSLGRIFDFDRMTGNIECILEGKIPVGKFDVDVHRLIKYNTYEGYRLGLGLHTNDQISKYFRIGGYFTYGFKDQQLKYGGDLLLHLCRENELDFKLRYFYDLIPAGAEKYIKYSINDWDVLIEQLFVDKWDLTTKQEIGFEWRSFKYFKLNLYLSRSLKIPQYDYYFGVYENNVTIKTNEFSFTEFSAGVKYAYGEKLFKTTEKKLSMGTKYPVIYLQYTKGLQGYLSGEYNYHRLDLECQKSFLIKNMGKSRVTLCSGLIEGKVPYTNLFIMPSGENDSYLYIPGSFATMKRNEYTFNNYIALFYTHNFGKFLTRKKYSEPEFQIITNICLSNSQNDTNHFGIKLNNTKSSFYESGFLINRILKFGFFSFGAGAFYRYGSGSSVDISENLVFRWTLSIPRLTDM